MNKCTISLKNEYGQFYFGWLMVPGIAALMVFSYSCIITVTGVFLLPVTRDLGLSIGNFSSYLTILNLSAILTLFLVSKFMTEKYIKKIMLLSAIAGGLAFLGFAMSSKLWHFFLLSIPMGVCFAGLSSTPCTILLSNWFGPKLRGTVISISLAFTAFGATVMTNVLQAIVTGYGWRTAYLVIAAGLIVICIPLILIFAVWNPGCKGIKRIGGESNEESGETAASASVTGMRFAAGLKKPSTWLAFSSATLIVIGSSAILQHTIASLTMSGYGESVAAGIFSSMLTALALGSILIGILCDRIQLRYSAVGTGALFVFAFLALIFMRENSFLVIVLILAYALGVPAVNIVTPILMNHMFGEKEIGKFMGYANAFISIGGASGAMIVGKIYDATGSYQPGWIFAIGCIILATAIRAVCAGKRYQYAG